MSSSSESDFDVPRMPRRAGKHGAYDPKVMGLWKVGRIIGQGATGRVRVARHSRTGEHAAVKIIDKTAFQTRLSLRAGLDEARMLLRAAEREITIMKVLAHPHVLRLHDVWETSSELLLVLEYAAGGELFDHLCIRGKLPLSDALRYFRQIVSALDYCHRLNICHRDLKPENILLDAAGNIKIADFGMAVWHAREDGLLDTACGSPHYAAPEVIRGTPYDGATADIWSCGVILYALLANRLPFDHDDLNVLLDMIMAGRYTIPTDVDPRAQNLLKLMLERDPARRVRMPDILRHPFFLVELPSPKKGATSPESAPLATLPVSINDTEPVRAIDPHLFANLKALWDDLPEPALAQKLVCAEPTWQKAVYHLLVQYRETHVATLDLDAERRAQEAQQRKREDKGAKPLSKKGKRTRTLPSPSPTPSPPRQTRVMSPVVPAVPLPPMEIGSVQISQACSYDVVSATASGSFSSLRHSRGSYQHSLSPRPVSPLPGYLPSYADSTESASLPPLPASPRSVASALFDTAFSGAQASALESSAAAYHSENGTNSVSIAAALSAELGVHLPRSPEMHDAHVQDFLQAVLAHLEALDDRGAAHATKVPSPVPGGDVSVAAEADYFYGAGASHPDHPRHARYSRYEDEQAQELHLRPHPYRRANEQPYPSPVSAEFGIRKVLSPIAVLKSPIADVHAPPPSPSYDWFNGLGLHYVPPATIMSPPIVPYVDPEPQSHGHSLSPILESVHSPPLSPQRPLSPGATQPLAFRASVRPTAMDIGGSGSASMSPTPCKASGSGTVARASSSSGNKENQDRPWNPQPVRYRQTETRVEGEDGAPDMDQSAWLVIDQEQADSGPDATGVTKKPRKVLGLKTAVVPGSKKRPAMLNLHLGAGQRTASGGSSTSDHSATSSHSNSPKPLEWIGGLFKGKPVCYQLLSTRDAATTRSECQRILEDMGVRVILQTPSPSSAHSSASDAAAAASVGSPQGALICVLPDGTAGTMPEAHFRVEIRRPSATQFAVGYAVAAHLIRERGSLASFKSVYNRLRREWEFDAPVGIFSHPLEDAAGTGSVRSKARVTFSA